MAEKKKEEGFTRFDNKVYDKLLSMKLSPAMLTAFLYVYRKTVGYRKEEDQIAIALIAKETGYSRVAMVNAIHALESMGMLELGMVVSGRATYMKTLPPKYWRVDR